MNDPVDLGNGFRYIPCGTQPRDSLEKAQADYFADRIELDEYEERVAAVLKRQADWGEDMRESMRRIERADREARIVDRVVMVLAVMLVVLLIVAWAINGVTPGGAIAGTVWLLVCLWAVDHAPLFRKATQRR